MFSKVLIANRGEIACRVIRTLKKLGVASVAVYSEADRDAPHVMLADEPHLIGPAPVAQSYLNQATIIETALRTGAEAIHPGYGLLSENAVFAEACEAAGIVFIGPAPEQLRAFGLKHRARECAIACGVPLVPGTELLPDAETALREAERVGYPVMLKSTAGGGGIGMRRCDDADALEEAFASVVRQGTASFGDGGVFLEKFIVNARHIEVQIFGDGRGRVLALGERDCSTQRRNQKIIEETPAPNLNAEIRESLLGCAVKLGEAIQYRSAGTVEFVVDSDSGGFYFLEVNTRLQVEHTVTEEVTGLDLVDWMIRLAAGELELPKEPVAPRGCAIQVRVYAEDPNKDFQPSCGLLTEVVFPEGVRCDGWVASGSEITPYYDPLLAKLIVWGADRAEALLRLREALTGTSLAGIETNLEYLRQIVNGEAFATGRMTTRTLAAFSYKPHTVDVLAPGTQTTVQDYPGRVGYWEVGVPPSGGMDPLSLRTANLLLGNPDTAAVLEITVSGPVLRFNIAAWICLCGADMPMEADGISLALWTPHRLEAGQTLRIGAAAGPGCRAYLAVQGGFDVPLYLGSRSTFMLGQVGGHAGRALRVGDVLPLGAPPAQAEVRTMLHASLRPRFEKEWSLGVLYGPHGEPDFFTEHDMDMFFTTAWEVHYNSARTGVRLIGPEPQWARPDGGEAGLHPSNIHDNAYAVGSVDFTGDMPILLGPDGPSLGGFVCPAVVVQAELWKMGQLRPGDRVRFHRLTETEARTLESRQERALAHLEMPLHQELHRRNSAHALYGCAVIKRVHSDPEVNYRPSGDRHLLVEFGPPELDIRLRFWVHAIYLALAERSHPAIIDLTPGIRSLQVHFDSRRLSPHDVISLVEEVRRALPPLDALEVPSRIVHLPLSWDDPATREAIEKYTRSVRADAPWCPSNIEFIRRINGLASTEEVRRIVFDSSYLVLGLGDVYLGAPVATPLDPRHRLVTTKYNPARTWTPENAVGIGGAYLCIYGMEGPGGYQFVGRTIQMWNRYRQTKSFTEGKPWLLRFFDQVRFYPVSAEELVELRRDFPQGRFVPHIEETVFNLGLYQAFLEREAGSIADFRTLQRRAFEEERQRWEAAGVNVMAAESAPQSHDSAETLEEGHEPVASPVNGSVWKVLVMRGDAVEAGQTVALVEAMKMEIQITSLVSGKVSALFCREGQAVIPGQNILAVAP